LKRILFTKSCVCIILCCAAVAANSACVKLPRRHASVSEQSQSLPPGDASAPRISLNTATRQQLETLPGIGPALAARIVEQRARYGPFRRAEHLLMVRGISPRRFRQLRPFVSVE